MTDPLSGTGGTEVPVIDIQPFLAGTDEDKDAVARQVGTTWEEIGFLTLTGHGVSTELVDRFRSVSQAFFDLAEPEKLTARAVSGRPGYHPFATQAVAQTLGQESPPDLKETFSIAPNPDSGDSYYHAPEASAWFATNRWPSSPAEFTGTWLEYFSAMEQLSNTLLQIFARALDLDGTYFLPAFDRHISRLAAVHYPPQPVAPEPGQLRNGPHTDYGAFTILSKPRGGGGGLQVRTKAGDWVDIVPPPESFVINIGDLVARWTNDRWVSTMHRVTNPRPEEASLGSISVVYFCQPNYDTRIVAPPTCVTESRPAKYPETTAGDYLTTKYRDQQVAAMS